MDANTAGGDAGANAPASANAPADGSVPTPATTFTPGAVSSPADTNSIPEATSSGIQVRVRGAPARPPVAAGEYRIAIGNLAEVPRRSAEDLLTLAPGLLLTSYGGEYHASGVFLRGFDAGVGQDIEFSLQGIPLNEVSNAHGHGYADAHFIIPELVSELGVVEGPFDPRQGDFAVAGSVRFTLGFGLRGVLAKAGLGSFGRRRVVALWGPSSSGPDTFAGVDFEDGNGFGPNRAFSSARAMAQTELELDGRTKVKLLAAAAANRFDSAGVVRIDDLEAGRLPCGPAPDEQAFCLYDPNQGGAGARILLSSHLTRRADRTISDVQVWVSSRSLRLRENFTGFLTDVESRSLGLPQRGDGVEPSYHALMIGSRGSLRWSSPDKAFLRDGEIGYFARHDDGDAVLRRLRTTGGIPYKVDADNKLRISNIAAFASARVAPHQRLFLTAGLRLDSFLFSVVDRNRPAMDRVGSRLTSDATDAYGLSLQPKMTATGILGGGFRAVGAFGIGTRSSDAQALSDGEFAPFARVGAAETGLTWSRTWGEDLLTDGRLIGFFTHVDRDLLFDEQAGRNTLAGASNRFGALTSLRAATPRSFDALASVTYAEAYQPPADDPSVAFVKGRRLPYIPRWVARLDATWRRAIPVRDRPLELVAATGFTYVAPRPLPYEQLSDSVVTWDAALRVAAGRFQVGLDVTNILDRRNHDFVFNYVSNFRGPEAAASMLPQRHVALAAPRALYVTLSYHQPAGDSP
jgi:hypothetical protein